MTKDGSLAGPKSLEHIVDTVLYFEGEKRQHHRVVRAVKNRFGPANEVSVFEMGNGGLKEVTNPSELFLGDRDEVPQRAHEHVSELGALLVRGRLRGQPREVELRAHPAGPLGQRRPDRTHLVGDHHEHGRGDDPPRWLRRWRGDGIIARIENDRIASAVVESGLPAVDVSAARKVAPLPWVETDDHAIAEAGARHLLERNFRQLAFCGDDRFNWSRWRCEHFQRAARELHLSRAAYFRRLRSASERVATWLAMDSSSTA